MRRAVLVPLDSRPINTDLPKQLAALAGIRLLIPPKRILGSLQRPADRRAVADWTLRQLEDAPDALIVSVDLLAYGGLVASRTQETTLREAMKNLDILRVIRRRFPTLTIFAFNVILRDAVTASDGESLKLWRRQMRGGKSGYREVSPLRERNFKINKLMMDWACEGVFDCLIIGKEDTADGNPNADEFLSLKSEAERCGKGRIFVQAGADELAQLLVARFVSTASGASVSFYLDATQKALSIIPKYEPCPFRGTLESQIRAAGGRISDQLAEADVVVVPMIPENKEKQRDIFLDQIERRRFVEAPPSGSRISRIAGYMKAGRCVGLIDAMNLNGSSAPLVEELLKSGIFFGLGSYAGWNTAANSSGTVVSHTVILKSALSGAAKSGLARRQFRFLAGRLADDYVYSRIVRGELAKMDDPMLVNYPVRVRRALESKMDRSFRNLMKKYVIGRPVGVFGASGRRSLVSTGGISRAELPWGRLFEARVVTEIKFAPKNQERSDG